MFFVITCINDISANHLISVLPQWEFVWIVMYLVSIVCFYTVFRAQQKCSFFFFSVGQVRLITSSSETVCCGLNKINVLCMTGMAFSLYWYFGGSITIMKWCPLGRNYDTGAILFEEILELSSLSVSCREVSIFLCYMHPAQGRVVSDTGPKQWAN